MKKIEIVTIFDNPNFGTYLQALALGVILKRFNYNVEILYYIRPKRYKYLFKEKVLSRHDFILKIYALLRNNKDVLQRIGCRSFVKKQVKISKPYFSYFKLENKYPYADIYLTGSDQVWNTLHNDGIDKVFYLGFVPDIIPKYSYGSSIGTDSIPEMYKNETKLLLNRYKEISVREYSNVNILSELGINSTCVLDPTLLLNSKEWLEYSKPFIKDENYVLVYSVETKEQNEIIQKIAKHIAVKNGLKIYEVSYTTKSICGCDRYFLYSTPDIFLSLVANASYIVGSSFHITAFAINFNKQFITVTPEKFTSRVDSLLDMLKLQNRKVSCYNQGVINTLLNEPITYDNVNALLFQRKESSFAFIRNIC